MSFPEAAVSNSAIVYRLRVELVDSDPPIWRSLWVRADTPLDELHSILAAVVGWSGEADYQFKAENPHLSGTPILAHADDPLVLQNLLSSQGDRLRYTYDLQRGWLHNVVLEAVQRAEPDLTIPSCIAGERCHPPEFCIGVWGYEELLERLEDAGDPDNDNLWQQVGYDFDPEKFDLAATNQRLRDRATV